MKQDLSRRFNRFKVADDTLASMKQMRDAREKNLDAAQQKLAAMINARRKLEVDIQNLEAKRKLVEVAQASSEYVFDDSQLARCKELIGDIRTRLDVAAKLANADVNVEVEIPLDEATPSDITDQVAEYFKLNGEDDRKSHRQLDRESSRSRSRVRSRRDSPTAKYCGSGVIHAVRRRHLCPNHTFAICTEQHGSRPFFAISRVEPARASARSECTRIL